MSKLIVADAGPVHYLALIDCADFLSNFFDQVVLPKSVQEELSHSNTPEKVRQWLAAPKAWLAVRTVDRAVPIAGLHRGEADALQLALQSTAMAVLIDDLDGRYAARRLGLAVFGTTIIRLRHVEYQLVT